MLLATLRLLIVYGAACVVVAVLADRYLQPLRLYIVAALVLLPMVTTGSAMLQGGFYGGLNLAYSTAPLLSDRAQLPRDFEEYGNGILMDQICQVVPWRKSIRELVKTGHWPLMNRFARGGEPLLGASQPAPFDPKVWIGFLLPLAAAVTFACSFVLFQAALFTYLLLRDLEISELGALFGAAVWMLCGFVDFYVTWSMASAMVPLPLVLLGVRRLALCQRGGFGAALAGWCLSLIGGHPETVLHVTSVAVLIFFAFLPRSPTPTRSIGRAVVAGILALCLSAPALLPFAETVPQTLDYAVRKGSHPSASVSLGVAADSALGAIYPFAWGEPWKGDRPGIPKRFNAATGAFVGGLALALALVALWTAPRRTVWVWGGLLLFTFAVAAGLPGIADAVGALPLFDIALNARLFAVSALALSVLAALGFDTVRQHPTRRRLGALALVGGLLEVGGLWRLSHMRAADVDTSAFVHSLSWLAWAPVAAAVVGLLMATWTPSRRARYLGWTWLAIFLVSHRAELPKIYSTFPAELFYPPVAELAELPRDGEPYRVVSRAFDMVPGQAALWELEDFRGPAVFNHRRAAEMQPLWCTQMGAWFCRVDSLESAAFDLFNVRYALGSPDMQPPLADWPRIIAGDHLQIWENPDVLPRAFSPREIEVADTSTTYAAMAQGFLEVRDFSRLAWLESDRMPPGRSRNGRAVVETRSDGSDLLIEVEAESPSWIFVSQTYWKGYRAETSQGERLPLVPANHAFLAFKVEPGAHQVRLYYRPITWELSWLLWALGLAILAVIVFREKRKSTRIRRSTGISRAANRVEVPRRPGNEITST